MNEIIAISGYLFLNIVILCIGYAIIKKTVLIKSWKFLLYTILVTLIGFPTNLIGTFMSFKTDAVIVGTILLSLFLVFLVLFLYNSWLARIFWKLRKKQAIFIGLLLAIFTNIVLALFLLQLPVFI